MPYLSAEVCGKAQNGCRTERQHKHEGIEPFRHRGGAAKKIQTHKTRDAEGLYQYR